MPCWWGWWQPRWWESPALAMGGPRGLCLAGRSVKAGLGPRCAGLVGGLQQGTVCLGGLLAWKCTAGDEQTGRRDGLSALRSEGSLPSVLTVVEGAVSGRPHVCLP